MRELTAQVVDVALSYEVPFHIITKSGEGILWLLGRVPELAHYERWWLALTIEAPPENSLSRAREPRPFGKG